MVALINDSTGVTLDYLGNDELPSRESAKTGALLNTPVKYSPAIKHPVSANPSNTAINFALLDKWKTLFLKTIPEKMEGNDTQISVWIESHSSRIHRK